jgi:hypothetical protein
MLGQRHGGQYCPTVILYARVAGLCATLNSEAGASVIGADAASLDGGVDLEAGASVIGADAASLDGDLDLETRVRNRLHVPRCLSCVSTSWNCSRCATHGA